MTFLTDNSLFSVYINIILITRENLCFRRQAALMNVYISNKNVRERRSFPFHTGGGTMRATTTIAKTAVTVVLDK